MFRSGVFIATENVYRVPVKTHFKDYIRAEAGSLGRELSGHA